MRKDYLKGLVQGLGICTICALFFLGFKFVLGRTDTWTGTTSNSLFAGSGDTIDETTWNSVIYKINNFTGNITEDRTNAAYQNNWFTYNNNPTDFPPARYRKNGDIVYIEGMIGNSASTTPSVGIIFTLPEGYRPSRHHHFNQRTNNGNCLIYIDSNGNVRYHTSGYSGTPGTRTSLAGIHFSTN